MAKRWLGRYAVPLALMGAGAMMWHAGVHPPTLVPDIGIVAGIRVGLDSREDAERLLGPGLEMTGGHPRGARAWWCPQQGWDLWADGFEHRRDGRDLIVEQAGTVYRLPGAARPGDPGVLTVRPRPGIWSLLDRSMDVRQVQETLCRAGVRPRPAGGAVVVRAHGFVDARDDLRYRTWEAHLEFRRNRLDWVRVECSEW